MSSPTTVELLWGTRQPPRRGPKPSLTLAGIVAEAIALADADGLVNLSMQRLAERLGYTKMSLYRYVPGKEQLIALMLDTAMGEPPEPPGKSPEPPGEPTWREALRGWALAIFERYRAHPWTLELAVGARPIGPNEMAWLEAAVVAMDGTGLTGPERLDTVVLLNGHVRSLAQQVGAAGKTDVAEQVLRQFADTMAAAADRYPAVKAAFAEEAARSANPPDDPGDALSFGIERVLDGLAVLIARRAAENETT
ncbi:TetR/AcrR family transcriptional regulator [Nocardia amikacinitolerans]|uniref:TetR/AcrR family transcriptional regulator n=1 Tax=Nocardia amikacinitolerans TaxID=756689 RepID=UPI0020A4959E|nr:TetR/AcrR family transcriptional regulator [Nocardia amikacinitolerans]MCP2291130.1 transcriptional regulator, TetR family [Nocardia amikacinitolerans]